VIAYLFGDAGGADAVRHAENTIRKLPGLEGFDLLGKACERACAGERVAGGGLQVAG
jgi:hypothetical protein